MKAKSIFDIPNRPAIVAHRGASAYYHENTLPAFKVAIEMGADGIELDVRRSRDGVLLVHHDARLRGEELPIADQSFDQVCDRAGRLGYDIPTLSDVLTLCAGRIKLDIELKETGYEAAVAAEVEKQFAPDQVMFTSFYDSAVAALKEYAPRSRVGLLLGHNLIPSDFRERRAYLPMRRVRRSHADFVAPHWQLLRFGFLRRLHNIGCPIAVWTVNRTHQAERLAARGVDVLITDVPDRLLKIW